MDKKLLFEEMKIAMQNIQDIKEEIEESLDKLKNNLNVNKRVVISCKAKDLPKELKKIEPELRKILLK